MILGGAIGNLIDRILFGEVVDFLDFMIGDFHWYIFNLADSSVTVGMSIFLYFSFFIQPKLQAKTAS
jgi:signal peptidase II